MKKLLPFLIAVSSFAAPLGDFSGQPLGAFITASRAQIFWQGDSGAILGGEMHSAVFRKSESTLAFLYQLTLSDTSPYGIQTVGTRAYPQENRNTSITIGQRQDISGSFGVSAFLAGGRQSSDVFDSGFVFVDFTFLPSLASGDRTGVLEVDSNATGYDLTTFLMISDRATDGILHGAVSEAGVLRPADAPEPATWGMLAIAGIGTLLFGKLRKKAFCKSL